MRRSAVVTLMLLLVGASALYSHDFWLIPSAFQLAPDGELVIHGQTSSDFPTSLSAVTVDRIRSAAVLTAAGKEAISTMDVSGNSLRLTHRPRDEGQALIAVAIHPRLIPESAESFRRYLDLEGAPEALERYEREGILPVDSITRRYAKYAKTLVQVGQAGRPVFDKIADHPLEFVPLVDPMSVRVGGSVRFRMMLLGEPVASARGHASVASSADAESAHASAEFETDDRGEFELPVLNAGIWNVRALYILPAPAASGADWDVHWATFVWLAGS